MSKASPTGAELPVTPQALFEPQTTPRPATPPPPVLNTWPMS
jgi:hypothetical protein